MCWGVGGVVGRGMRGGVGKCGEVTVEKLLATSVVGDVGKCGKKCVGAPHSNTFPYTPPISLPTSFLITLPHSSTLLSPHIFHHLPPHPNTLPYTSPHSSPHPVTSPYTPTHLPTHPMHSPTPLPIVLIMWRSYHVTMLP